MNKRPVQKHLIHVLLASLAILLIGGGIALLNQWQQGPVPSHASDDNVVGPPSLSASFVDTIFRRLGSPMVGAGQAVEEAAQAQHIDDAFALAVWWTETNDGAAGVGLNDRNPGSVRGSVGYPSAYDGYTIYPSYSAAASYWFSMLRRVYINRGLTTVSAIAHPYVGTSTSYLWAGKVIALMDRYRAEAPPLPPPATPIPTAPSVDTAAAQANFVRHAKAFMQQYQNDPVLPATADNAHAQAQQAPASGLSGNAKWLLVFFNLLAALGIALVARNMLQRYSTNAKIASLLGESLQAKVRAGFQQTAASFAPFTNPGTFRTTENLTWAAPMTGALATPTAMLPTSSSDALFPLGAFMAAQTQELANTPRTYPEPWQQPQPSTSPAPAMRLPGLGLPSRPMSQPAPSALRRTSLITSHPTMSQFAPLATDVPSDALPQLVGVGASNGRASGLLSRYRETQGAQ